MCVRSSKRLSTPQHKTKSLTGLGARTVVLQSGATVRSVGYFVRTMEMHKESTLSFSAEVPYSGLRKAADEAKRRVLDSDPAIMLQADACFRNRNQVPTKYRCWINERGEFHEQTLV